MLKHFNHQAISRKRSSIETEKNCIVTVVHEHEITLSN